MITQDTSIEFKLTKKLKAQFLSEIQIQDPQSTMSAVIRRLINAYIHAYQKSGSSAYDELDTLVF